MTSAQALPLPSFERPVKLLAVLAVCAEGESLLAGARTVAEQAGASLELVEMPGAAALPTALGMAARLTDFDGFLALGAEGAPELPEARHALALLGLQGLCIGTGLAMPGTGVDQGAAAARAALHLVALSRKWARSGRGMGFLPEGSFRIAADEGPTRA